MVVGTDAELPTVSEWDRRRRWCESWSTSALESRSADGDRLRDEDLDDPNNIWGTQGCQTQHVHMTHDTHGHMGQAVHADEPFLGSGRVGSGRLGSARRHNVSVDISCV